MSEAGSGPKKTPHPEYMFPEVEPLTEHELAAIDSDGSLSKEDLMLLLRSYGAKGPLSFYKTIYNGVPVFRDLHESEYRDVLQAYERYMLTYESRAEKWTSHYANVQHSIDSALGIAGGGLRSKPTKAEEERLSEIGTLAIFGCGFNPLRELSPKLKKALADKKLRLVLIDFSQRSLESSINFLDNAGIQPQAAYQMDMTSGSAAYLNTRMTEIKNALGGNLKGKLEVFLTFFEYEVAQLIAQFKANGLTPLAQKNDYLIREKDRPGLGVSTMIVTATFLTIFSAMEKIINSYYSNEEEKEACMQKLKQIHAKYNAFIAQMNAMKISSLCKGDANVLMIADVNKVMIGVDTNVEDEEIREEREETAKKVMGAVESQIENDNPEVPEGAPNFAVELRASRDGLSTESLESIIRDSSHAIRKMIVQVPADGEKPKKWMWWDEPGHGHRVEAVNFTVEKKNRTIILRFLNLLPSHVIENGCATESARLVKELFLKRIAERERANPRKTSSSRASLEWLQTLEIPDENTSDELLSSRRSFMHLAACEIIEKVPKEVFESGSAMTLAYLEENEGWKNDGLSLDHIRCGLAWLRDFSNAIRLDVCCGENAE